MLLTDEKQRSPATNSGLAKVAGSVLRMTVFTKFEVCASYEHLWLNRHLRQAANRCTKFYSKRLVFLTEINAFK